MNLLKHAELERQTEDSPVLVKLDDTSIPNFAKDIYSSRKLQSFDLTNVISYKWPEQKVASEVDSLKVIKAEIKKGDLFEKVSKISIKDGMDSLVVKFSGALYLLRRTKEEVAKSLLSASFKLKVSIESIIGYIKTALGNFYVISKIENGTWTFDEKLAVEGVNRISFDKLDSGQKSKFVEMLVEKLAQVHSSKLVIGLSSVKNILINARDLVFTDLRKLRVSRRSEPLISEFITIMRYLYSNGFANYGDIVHATTYYSTALERECKEWHFLKSGKKSKDQMEILSSLESQVLNS